MAEYRNPRIPLEDRFLIEEGNVPRGAYHGFAAALPLLRLNKEARKWIKKEGRSRLNRISRDFRRKFSRNGALNHSVLLLGMGHDGSKGKFVLDQRGNEKIKWRRSTEERCFKLMSSQMREMNKAIQGTFVEPSEVDPLGNDPTTVHPLGGCVMSDTAETGVCDHKGRVFNSDSGSSTHEGLYAVDASVISTSLGVNPFITISAIAERIADHYLMDRFEITTRS